MRQQKQIERLGTSRYLWRLLMNFKTTVSFETGDGLVSTAVPWNVQQVMQSEITRKAIREAPGAEATA